MLMCLTSGQPGHQQSGVSVHCLHCLISCSQAVPCWWLLMVAAEHKCQHTMTWYTVGRSLSENRSTITHTLTVCLCIAMLASRHVLTEDMQCNDASVLVLMENTCNAMTQINLH